MNVDINTRLEKELDLWITELKKAVEEEKLSELMDSVLELTRKQTLTEKWETTGYELLLAWGGPTVWLDTDTCEIVGNWAPHHITKKVNNEICDKINEYLDEIYEE